MTFLMNLFLTLGFTCLADYDLLKVFLWVRVVSNLENENTLENYVNIK